jgi:hypothetical protein
VPYSGTVGGCRLSPWAVKFARWAGGKFNMAVGAMELYSLSWESFQVDTVTLALFGPGCWPPQWHRSAPPEPERVAVCRLSFPWTSRMSNVFGGVFAAATFRREESIECVACGGSKTSVF